MVEIKSKECTLVLSQHLYTYDMKFAQEYVAA